MSGFLSSCKDVLWVAVSLIVSFKEQENKAFERQHRNGYSLTQKQNSPVSY
jgi:hypothetical protein